MAYSDLDTFVSLDECAEIIGANPALFNQGYAHGVVEACGLDCSGLWVEWPWQIDTGMARQPLARQLMSAELAVEQLTGLPIAPKKRTKIYRIWNGDSIFTGVTLAAPKFAIPGYVPKVPVFIGSYSGAAIEILDVDGDSFTETIRISFVSPVELNKDNILLYVGNRFGNIGSRIRPVRNVSCTQINDNFYDVVIEIKSWQAVLPSLIYNRAFGKNIGVDLSSPSSYVSSFDIGYLKNDNSAPMARFFYDIPDITCGSPTCVACADSYLYGGWEIIGDRIRVFPAKYNEETKQWEEIDIFSCSCGRAPSSVEISWYESLLGESPSESLITNVKEAICLIAAARFNRVQCDCECGSQMIFRDMQTDLSVIQGGGRYITAHTLNCPLGTRRGEIEAWNILKLITGASGVITRAFYA